jgi:hypothetical protein
MRHFRIEIGISLSVLVDSDEGRIAPKTLTLLQLRLAVAPQVLACILAKSKQLHN